MAVTGVSPALREPLISEVGRIVNSEVLRGSESLCQLLGYLASHSVGERGHSVKEYQIATEVFGRAADFDPRLDSTVRVQTSRLRAKLAEYYAGPGAHDDVIVEIPRGAYSVTVHARVPAEVVPQQPEIGRPEPSPVVRRNPYKIAAWLLVMFCCGLIASLAWVIRNRPAPVAEARPEVPAPLKAFWRVFTGAPERTWIVFSNAEFVGRPETGLRYLDPAKDKRDAIFDHYTGIGEVMAIHELDQLFTELEHGVVVKRGRLLAMDDVKNNDLIFVGSPSENLTLRDLPAMQEFQFRRGDSGSRKADLRIVNLHPAAGEQEGYFTTAGLPLTEDYAVIGLMPGPTREHWVMTLAGITTIGTQAAVEYVCSGTSVEQLLKKVRRAGAEIMPFEALLRVSVSRGVPVSSQLVAVHMRTP
ncbi:MAG: helix-turn-helix domain-containing protein [Bryobacteraceae bacterium]